MSAGTDRTQEAARRFDDGKTPDTPEQLARWVWCQFVGIPITEPYDAMYLQLLERIQFMHRVQFTLGLRECLRQIKEREQNLAAFAESERPRSEVQARDINKWAERILAGLRRSGSNRLDGEIDPNAVDRFVRDELKSFIECAGAYRKREPFAESERSRGTTAPMWEALKIVDYISRDSVSANDEGKLQLAKALAKYCLQAFSVQVSEHPDAVMLRNICYAILRTNPEPESERSREGQADFRVEQERTFDEYCKRRGVAPTLDKRLAFYSGFHDGYATAVADRTHAENQPKEKS